MFYYGKGGKSEPEVVAAGGRGRIGTLGVYGFTVATLGLAKFVLGVNPRNERHRLFTGER